MRNPEKRGYDEFFSGADLTDNPYSRDSQESREWEKGNWEAYDDRKRERRERGEE